MKSILFIFIISLLSISNIQSKEEGCGKITSDFSKEKCNDALNEDDKKNYEKCCFVKYKKTPTSEEIKGCQLLTKYQFEHVKDVIKATQYQYSNTYTLECKAYYIKFSLLSLALLFI